MTRYLLGTLLFSFLIQLPLSAAPHGHKEELSAGKAPKSLSVSVITHADNPLSNLSLQQLELIFSGDASNWRAVNNEDQSMRIYVPAEDEASLEAFRGSVLDGRDFGENAVYLKDPVSVLAKVSKYENAIGIVAFPFDRTEGIKVLAVNGKGPNVSNYPILVEHKEDEEKEIHSAGPEKPVRRSGPAPSRPELGSSILGKVKVSTGKGSSDSKNVEMLGYARALLSKGDLNGAKAILSRLASENPNNAEAQRLLVDVNKQISLSRLSQAPAPSMKAPPAPRMAPTRPAVPQARPAPTIPGKSPGTHNRDKRGIKTRNEADVPHIAPNPAGGIRHSSSNPGFSSASQGQNILQNLQGRQRVDMTPPPPPAVKPRPQKVVDWSAPSQNTIFNQADQAVSVPSQGFAPPPQSKPMSLPPMPQPSGSFPAAPPPLPSASSASGLPPLPSATSGSDNRSW